MATFTTADGLTSVSFKYTATTAKIVAVVGDASEMLFDRGLGDHGDEEAPIVFADLTNQDRLDIVDGYLKNVIVNMANDFKLKSAKDAVEVVEHEM